MARPPREVAAWSPDPLDNKADIGPYNQYLELLKELRDMDDPLAIIIRCEEIDLDEGRPHGTSLELYLKYLTNTH